MTSRIQEYLSSVPIVTRSLLFINISIHALIFLFTYPLNSLSINPVLVVYYGEFYRIISSTFVHGSFMHILMNMSSLLPLGTQLETTFGSMKFMLITLWAIIMCGIIFCLENWIYSLILMNPYAMNNNAVGYSGVLFCYALIESFHNVEQSRSICGISVPTKCYPVIMLILIQVIMPNISLFGHLAGLTFGLIIISRVGNNVFMPSDEFLRYLDTHPYLTCCTRITSYSLTKDRDLVHPALEMHRAGGMCSMCTDTIRIILGHIWNVISTFLYIIGFPTDWVCNYLHDVYKSLTTLGYMACAKIYSMLAGHMATSAASSNASMREYELVSTTTTVDDVESNTSTNNIATNTGSSSNAGINNIGTSANEQPRPTYSGIPKNSRLLSGNNNNNSNKGANSSTGNSNKYNSPKGSFQV